MVAPPHGAADQRDGVCRAAVGEDVLAALHPLLRVRGAAALPPSGAGGMGTLQWLERAQGSVYPTACILVLFHLEGIRVICSEAAQPPAPWELSWPGLDADAARRPSLPEQDQSSWRSRNGRVALIQCPLPALCKRSPGRAGNAGYLPAPPTAGCRLPAAGSASLLQELSCGRGSGAAAVCPCTATSGKPVISGREAPSC